MSEIALQARAIAKSYGGVEALKGMDFALKRGEVHGLIGANGAGKSTFCKIIAGIEAPSAGHLFLDGAQVTFASVREATEKGIDIIHQELSLFPNLSVAENMFMGRELLDRLGMVDHEAQEREARAVLQRLGYQIQPDASVGDLPIGAQQIVEIARALTHKAHILMMDEPTSALSRAEVVRLFEITAALKAQGVSIVYISHRLDEMLEICDRITVMRDGAVIECGECSTIDAAWIIERMTGEAAKACAHATPLTRGEGVLELSQVSLPRRVGRVALTDLSFRLHAGEVLGVFGMLGAGCTELFETLLGVHRDARGVQRAAGRDLSKLDIAERLALGLAMVPKDRQRDGLIGTISVLRNMTVSIVKRLARFGYLPGGVERACAERMIDALRIKSSGVDSPVETLSGGNQQKVVLARSLLSEPKVLLLDEPTRGVDVAAKAEIQAEMHRLARAGVAILFASSDVREVLSTATRILVMSRGVIALETTPEHASEATLLEAASLNAHPAEMPA